jgi:ATP-dependent DNA ligase
MLSKSGQDLSRYFPEIVSAALSLRAKNFVLNGEIVVPVGGQFSFDDLLQRIHPAASRVRKLAAEASALYRALDLLKESKKEIAAEPLSDRRGFLEDFAKGLDLAYQAGNRDGMQKIKKYQSPDCVMGAGNPLAGQLVVFLREPFQSFARGIIPYQRGHALGRPSLRRNCSMSPCAMFPPTR